MLHEVILALLGHPGEIIQEEPTDTSPRHAKQARPAATGRFRVPDTIIFLTRTEREAINRLVGMGSTYRDLRNFVRPEAFERKEGVSSVRETEEEGGLYLRALKLGVCEVLDEYAARIAEVERDVMIDPTLTLARVHAGVREVRDPLYLMVA